MEKIVERFIRTLRSEKTKRDYSKYINDFLTYKNIDSLDKFKGIDIDDYYDWRDYLINELNNSENSLRPKFTAISSFYKYLKANPKYEIDNNPILDGELNKKNKAIVNPARRTWLTDTEKKLFLEACKNPRETAIVGVFLNTAIRVSELIDLQLEEYTRFTNKNGELAAYLYFKRKGGKIKKLYFNPSVTKKIDEYLKVRKETDCTNLFVSNTGNPMSTQSIDMTLKKLARKAGINKNISAHSLRRTVATDMHKQGIDLKSIQTTLGHNNAGTTGIYIQEIEEDTEDLMMDYIVE